MRQQICRSWNPSVWHDGFSLNYWTNFDRIWQTGVKSWTPTTMFVSLGRSVCRCLSIMNWDFQPLLHNAWSVVMKFDRGEVIMVSYVLVISVPGVMQGGSNQSYRPPPSFTNFTEDQNVKATYLMYSNAIEACGKNWFLIFGLLLLLSGFY